MIIKLPLKTKNKNALIDDSDFNLVKDFKWYLFKTDKKEYATTTCRLINGAYQPLGSLSQIAKDRRPKVGSLFKKGLVYPKNSLVTVFLHRLIMNPQKGMEVDHMDGNGLNNSRQNLRICSREENGRNRKLSSLNTSGFHGVCFTKTEKRRKRWLAVIRAKGKKITLGRFHTKEEAAFVYNQAAKKYHGEFATLNKLELEVYPELK